MVGLPPDLSRGDLHGQASRGRESAADPGSSEAVASSPNGDEGAVLAAVAATVWLYAGFWWSFWLVVALAVGWLAMAMLFFRKIPMG